jgi:hypothetical protein
LTEAAQCLLLTQSRHAFAFASTRRNPIAIKVRSSNLHRIAIEFRADTVETARNIMSAQIPRPIGSIAFASALLLPGLGVSTPANTAQAACLTAPNSSAPQNSHWHYRTDRTQQRKCWYLSAPNQPSQQEAVQTAGEAALAKPTQAAMHSHEGGTKLSNEDVEKLYAEFLEWNRRAKSPGK